MTNYKIKKYNGTNSPIPELIGHTNMLDTSTSLGFYSQGYDYGAQLNTNMLHLMEHFRNILKPANPVMGQLWFDSLNTKMMVFNGSGWDALNFGKIIQKELQWSGVFSQATIGQDSTISGTWVATGTGCIFKNGLTTNSNQSLADYIITGNLPSGLTVNVTANTDVLYNCAEITLSGTIPASTPTFTFKIEFTSYAFTNVLDISEVNNTSNTSVILMTHIPITTTTTVSPTTTTTTAVPTTTTTTSAATQLSAYNSIKFGITWGGGGDLDTVVAAYDASGICTAMSTVSYPTAIAGVSYGGDIRSGGIEEYYNIDLTQLTGSKLVLGVLEYTDNSFSTMSSLAARIADNSTSTNITEYTLNTVTKTPTNTPNTTYIVGVFTKVGSSWTFEPAQKLINSHSGKHAIVPSDLYSSLGL